MNGKCENYDVIIVGSGIAGLYSALNLSKKLKVAIFAKKTKNLSNSSLAQGGIAAVYKNPNDSTQEHKNDTLIAGGYENVEETLDILVNEAKIDIENIINYNVNFDKTEDGDFHRTLEGGHSKRRIFHLQDYTGREITEKLLVAVSKLENVTLFENSLVCDVKKTKTGFSFNVLQDGEYKVFNSKFCVLATGGIGRIYKFTTNSSIATGDGISFAYNMGVDIKNLNYIQFHPTAFNNHETRECFLISEAVRGEGAYLRNCNKERFMERYDSRKELAPRDVVSHAIIEETKKTNSDEFYLDITYKDSDFIKNRFPMIYQNLLKQGFDMTCDLIPIYPCQHYLMGGIKVDVDAKTSVEGLFACGECSCTGVHGNNRLASNSLLEALVFSRRAASVINAEIVKKTDELESFDFENTENYPKIPKGLRTKIRTIMQESYFVLPDFKKMRVDFEEIKRIKTLLETEKFCKDSDYVIAKSLATIAFIIFSEVLCETN